MTDKGYTNDRRTYLADLLKDVTARSSNYTAAEVIQTPNNALRITLSQSVTDLNRFKSLTSTTSYLYARDQNKIFNLGSMQDDAPKTEVVA